MCMCVKLWRTIRMFGTTCFPVSSGVPVELQSHRLFRFDLVAIFSVHSSKEINSICLYFLILWYILLGTLQLSMYLVLFYC